MTYTFDFTPGNSNIDGKVVVDVSRNSSGYTVSFNVKYRRNNSWTGTATSGTIEYTVYVNDSTVSSGKQPFTIPNGGTEVSLVSGKTTINLNALKSSTFTVGYYSIDRTSGYTVTAFNFTKTTFGPITVSAFAETLDTDPTITGLKDNGDNTFSFNFSTPSNPTNNSLTNTLTIYRDDSSSSEAVNSDSSDSRLYEVTSANNSTVTAKISLESKPTYGSSKTASSSKTINYWKAPGTQPTAKIQPMRNSENISKITPKCTLRCQWDMAPVGNANSEGLEHNGCRFYFYILRKGTPNWESYGDGIGDNGYKYVDIYYNPLTIEKNSPGFVCHKKSDSNSFYIDINSETYNLQKGDFVCVGIQPFTVNFNGWGWNSYWIGSTANTEQYKYEVKSAGIVNIKQSTNSWNEGQAYIKTANGWLEADSVYIKDNSGWKESI